MHLIYDLESAIESLHKILKPGGVLLLTVPGISPSPGKGLGGYNDYWRFTSASVRRLFAAVFGEAHVDVRCYGNVYAATAFLHGLAQEELDALARFIYNGRMALRGPRITTAYSANCGGGGKRSGGVHDRDRLAYNEFELMLSRLPQQCHPILKELIEDGATSLRIGQWLLPGVKTESMLRSAGRAWIKAIAQQLLHFDRMDAGCYPGAGRKISAQVKAERMARRRLK